MRLLRIEIETPEASALAAHLERFGCHVVARDGARLDVEFPEAQSEREARTEAALYLSFWSGHDRAHPPVVLAA